MICPYCKATVLSTSQPYIDPDFDKAGNRRYWEQRNAREAALAAAPAVGVEADRSLDICLETYGLDYMQRRHVVEKVNAKILAALEAAIEECAKLIESGAGMADLIDQEELDQQAKYIRALAAQPASPLRGREDGEQLWGRFVNHYWDGFEGDKELVLKHVRAVLDYHAANSAPPEQPAAPKETT